VGTPGVTRRSGEPDSDSGSFRISPLALGLGVRLLWATGLAALLWLAAAWALEWLP
jgi:hypothetical protein